MSNIKDAKVLPLPPPLPTTIEEWNAARVVKIKRTLADHVDDIHCILGTNEKYNEYLYAVYDSQAVEGSLVADNLEAARMIRTVAKDRGIDEVSKQNLTTIMKAHKVVLRRYNNSRKQRRLSIGGRMVPDNGGLE